MGRFVAFAMASKGEILLRDPESGGEMSLSRADARSMAAALQQAERAFWSGEAFDDERRALARAFPGPAIDRSARTLAQVDADVVPAARRA